MNVNLIRGIYRMLFTAPSMYMLGFINDPKSYVFQVVQTTFVAIQDLKCSVVVVLDR